MFSPGAAGPSTSAGSETVIWDKNGVGSLCSASRALFGKLVLLGVHNAGPATRIFRRSTQSTEFYT